MTFFKLLNKGSKVDYNLIESFFAQGANDTALALLDNYLMREPGDLKIIRYYQEKITSLIEADYLAGHKEDALVKERWLVNFLRECTKRVDVNYVPEIMESIQKYAPPTPIQSTTVTPVESGISVDEYANILISSSEKSASRNITLMNDIRNILGILTKDDANYEKLKESEILVATTLSFEDLSKQFSSLLEQKEHLVDSSLRIYYLQQCEVIIKESALLLSKLEKNFHTTHSKMKKTLKEEYSNHQKEINGIRWTNFINDLNKRYKKDIKIANKSIKSNVKATIILDTITRTINNITNEYNEIFNGHIVEGYSEYLENLQQQYSNWSELRYSNYQSWAVGKIKDAFKEGGKSVHTVKPHDREIIAGITIKHLGDIDQTLLRPLFARLYSECLEYFLSKLKVPKDNHFTEKNSKLRVLDQIANKRKKSLEAF